MTSALPILLNSVLFFTAGFLARTVFFGVAAGPRFLITLPWMPS